MFVSPGEILFSIGRVSVHYYGIVMALALTIGVLCAWFVTKKFYPEIDPEVIYDISPHIIIFAILGARLYYCLLCADYYFSNPLEIFQIWHGGLSIHGGIVGGIIGGLIYAKGHSLPVLKLCDIFSYGLVLGQAVGRWGNFFNSEAFGLPTNSFLKLYIPIYKRPIEYFQSDYFHPTFLYESFLNLCIFFVLFFVVRKLAKNCEGIVFFSYLILYSIARIAVEQVRLDSVLSVWGLPVAQFVSIILFFAGVAGLFTVKFYCKK